MHIETNSIIDLQLVQVRDTLHLFVRLAKMLIQYVLWTALLPFVCSPRHQSDEIGDDEHMEKEGLRRSLDLLERCGVDVDYMVTERQTHILSYLTERKITQYTDVWLMEKGTSPPPSHTVPHR